MKYILIFLLLFITSVCYADELQIPFGCWAKDLQIEFAKVGKKLDLESGERTKDSWAFLKNKGSEFIIYTYNPVTSEDFEQIMKIVNEIELRKREE